MSIFSQVILISFEFDAAQTKNICEPIPWSLA